MLNTDYLELAKEDALEARASVIPLVLDFIKNVEETDNGYLLNLGRNAQALSLAAQWMMLERVCNPFLRVAVSSESNTGPIRVEIGGPAGTQDYLRTELGLSRWL